MITNKSKETLLKLLNLVSLLFIICYSIMRPGNSIATAFIVIFLITCLLIYYFLRYPIKNLLIFVSVSKLHYI